MILDFLCGIILVMGVAIALQRRGRPRFIPKVKVAYDRQLQTEDAFYEICATFHYREIVGWASFLGRHPFTIERWKYGMSFPKDDVVQQIIEWDRDGRPWEKVETGKSTSRMV